MDGYPCSPYFFTKDNQGKTSLEFRTLFAQEMMKSRILVPWIALSYSHGEDELAKTLEATRASLLVYAKAIDEGIDKYLIGSSVKPVFRKYN
jgi:glutamate-1-semialdehyde 2,1-aminomutase